MHLYDDHRANINRQNEKKERYDITIHSIEMHVRDKQTTEEKSIHKK